MMRRSAPLLFLLLLLLPLSGAWANCLVNFESIVFSTSYKYSGGSCDYSEREGVMVNNCTSLDETINCICSYHPEFCTLDNVNRKYKQSLGYGYPELNQNPLTYFGFCPERAGYPHMYHFYLYCNTQTELDSAVCVNGGKQWINGQCRDVCEAEKNICNQVNGTWTPGASSDETCNGGCDFCGGEKYQQLLKNRRLQCCADGYGVNSGYSGCFMPSPPWIGAVFSDYNLANTCNYNATAQFDSWCLENAGDDTTQSSSSQSPDCFGTGCPSSSSMSSSSGTGGGEGGSSSSESGGGEGGSSGEESSSSEGGGGEGGSSGEESSSSESGGGEGGNGKDTVYIGNGEDWEYNYYPELDTLIKYMKGVFGLSLQLGDKIDEATAELGSKIVQWQPGKLDSIISELKAIKSLAGQGTGGDSSGGYWDGDSAISALWDSLAQFGDTSGFGSLFGTADGDSALDSLQRFLDGNDSLYGSLGGQLDSLGGAIGDAIRGLADSGAVGAFRDSLQKMADKFDYKRFTGSGGCPAFLTQKTTIKFGLFSAEIPAVGDLLCTTKISIFGRTPWEFGRALIRAIVAISCMFWLFKVATGATGGDDD